MLIDIQVDITVGNVIPEFRGKVEIGEVTLGNIKIQMTVKAAKGDEMKQGVTGIKNRGGPSIDVKGILTFRDQGEEESAMKSVQEGVVVKDGMLKGVMSRSCRKNMF